MTNKDIAATTDTALGDGFDQPQVVSDVLIAFPGSVAHLMPAYESIPEDFRGGLDGYGDARQWRKFQSDWMFRGLSKTLFEAKPGIEFDAAWRHLKCIQGSFEPKHEHKEAAVAWLMSRWFDLSAARRSAGVEAGR